MSTTQEYFINQDDVSGIVAVSFVWSKDNNNPIIFCVNAGVKSSDGGIGWVSVLGETFYKRDYPWMFQPDNRVTRQEWWAFVIGQYHRRRKHK